MQTETGGENPHRGLATFSVVWTGQLLSTIGSNLTSFAVGVWVFQQTGSATLFSLISFLVIMPSVFISPFVGALVDRWDRRIAMIVGDSGAGMTTLVLAVLIFSDRLEIWHLYVVAATNSVFTGLQWPAYTAATSLLVPKKHLGRASGLVQIGQGISQLITPAMGGVFLTWIGLGGVILIDGVTFLLAVGTLLFVRFPRAPRTREGDASRGSLFKESMFGFTYIRARLGLLGLLLFLATINFFVGTVQVLATPVILLAYGNNPVTLGLLLSTGGIGMMVGSIVMGIWGGPKRLVNGVLGFAAVTAVGIFASGFLPESTFLLGFFIFLILLGVPFTSGCNQAIWQRKVHYDVQGRVFGIRQAIATSSLPIAYLIAGPLADVVFEPFMSSGSPLAVWIGTIIRPGPGSGIGLLFIILGAMLLVAVPIAYRSRAIRMIEDDLPDADEVE